MAVVRPRTVGCQNATPSGLRGKGLSLQTRHSTQVRGTMRGITYSGLRAVRTMNKRQRIVLLAACSLLIVLCLFPPWNYPIGRGQYSRIVSHGHSWIGLGNWDFGLGPVAPQIDWQRLSIELLAILALAVLLICLLGTHRTGDSTRTSKEEP